MNKKFGALSVLLFAFASTAQAAPLTITFGLEGSSFFTTSRPEVSYYNPYTDPNDLNSGYRNVADAASVEWVAYNPGYYSPSSFNSSSGELFSLDSFWLAGAWGSQTLTITGYAGGDLINITTIAVNTTAQEYFFSGFEEIDTFSIAIGNDFVLNPNVFGEGQHWALGSVTVTVAGDHDPDPTLIPEPETWVLLLAGLGIMGAVIRRPRTLRRF